MASWSESEFIHAMRTNGKSDQEIAEILKVDKIAPAPTKHSKYHNNPVYRDGLYFHSTKEANRYSDLKLLEKAGEISELKRQQLFILQDQPKIAYFADFTYFDKDSNVMTVEDVKGFKTKEYELKKKMLLNIFGARIRFIET